jgi:hypothetical protein
VTVAGQRMRVVAEHGIIVPGQQAVPDLVSLCSSGA